MLKKLAKKTIAVADLILGMASADALAGPTTIEIKENGLGDGPITVISQNFACWPVSGSMAA